MDEALADPHRDAAALPEAAALLVTHGVALELLATVATVPLADAHRDGALELDNNELADVFGESLTVTDAERDSNALEDAL